MLVYVLNISGEPLMPCRPQRARKLLEEGKAKVVNRTPFTIRLSCGSSGYKQLITLGVDPGYQHLGLSAVSEKQELYGAEVLLRTDMVKLLSERRSYRRNRRGRKTRYRQAKFLNRTKAKKQGWLAPSVQHRLDSHVKAVDRVRKILPVTRVVVEAAAFNIQKIQNPEIQGVDYQQGPQKDFWNVREYVLYRDGHRCQHCLGRSKDKVLTVHHLESRKIGGDRPDNLTTLCRTCHGDHHAGRIKLKQRRAKGFKAETFMALIRKRLIEELKCESCFGYETKQRRFELGIPKSHVNDAFVIAHGTDQPRCQHYLVKQVRKQNRKLFKGPHSGVRNTAARFIRGFQRFDKVQWKGQACFVFGRRSTGYFDLKLLDGTKVHASAKARDCKLLESSSTWLVAQQQTGEGASSLP
jgi:hypothetical protein